MTIEQEQKCAIEALSRASDVTQRLMFREGAKWMGAEHAAAPAESQKRVAELEAEVESLKGGVNPRSMRMNNRSLRMK